MAFFCCGIAALIAAWNVHCPCTVVRELVELKCVN